VFGQYRRETSPFGDRPRQENVGATVKRLFKKVLCVLLARQFRFIDRLRIRLFGMVRKVFDYGELFPKNPVGTVEARRKILTLSSQNNVMEVFDIGFF
jgi:hypothetical protein